MTFVAEMVRSHPRPGSNSNGNLVAPALVRRYGKVTDSDATDAFVVAASLTSGGQPNSNAPGRRKEDDENLVAFHPTQDPISGPISHALGSEPTGSVAVAYALTTEASVRRLTPVECARLQGLPDDWFDGVPGTSDSKMYAGLGDAVTVNVAQWIGERIRVAL